MYQTIYEKEEELLRNALELDSDVVTSIKALIVDKYGEGAFQGILARSLAFLRLTGKLPQQEIYVD